MIKTGRIILRIVFIGLILAFFVAKVFELKPKGEREKRIRHVDRTTNEFDEIW